MHTKETTVVEFFCTTNKCHKTIASVHGPQRGIEILLRKIKKNQNFIHFFNLIFEQMFDN